MPLHYTVPGLSRPHVSAEDFLTTLDAFAAANPEYAFLLEGNHITPDPELDHFREKFITFVSHKVNVPRCIEFIRSQQEPATRLECLTKFIFAQFRNSGSASTNASVPTSNSCTDLTAKFTGHSYLRREQGGIRFSFNILSTHTIEQVLANNVDDQPHSNTIPARVEDDKLVKFLSDWLLVLSTDHGIKPGADLHYEQDQSGAARILLAELANIFFRCGDNFSNGNYWPELNPPQWNTAKQERTSAITDWALVYEGRVLAFLEWKRLRVLSDSDMQAILSGAQSISSTNIPRGRGFVLFIEDGTIKVLPENLNRTLTRNAKKACLQMWAEHFHYQSRNGILYNGSSTMLTHLQERNHVELSAVIPRVPPMGSGSVVNILSSMVAYSFEELQAGRDLFAGDEESQNMADTALQELEDEAMHGPRSGRHAPHTPRNNPPSRNRENNRYEFRQLQQNSGSHTSIYPPKLDVRPDPLGRRFHINPISSKLKFVSHNSTVPCDDSGRHHLWVKGHIASGALWEVYRGTLIEGAPQARNSDSAQYEVHIMDPTSTLGAEASISSSIHPRNPAAYRATAIPAKRSSDFDKILSTSFDSAGSSSNSIVSTQLSTWNDPPHNPPYPPPSSAGIEGAMYIERDVVVKFTRPSLFRKMPNISRLDNSESLTQTEAEAGVFTELESLQHLNDLQGSMVPILYGLYIATLSDPGSNVGDKVYMMITSYEGTAACSEWAELANGQKHELVDTVARLHEHGLVHGDIEPRHYLIGGGLGLSRIPKIIDFDRARYINIDSAIPGEGSFKFMMEEEKLRLSALLDLPKSVWEVSAARHRKASLGRDSIVH